MNNNSNKNNVSPDKIVPSDGAIQLLFTSQYEEVITAINENNPNYPLSKSQINAIEQFDRRKIEKLYNHLRSGCNSSAILIGDLVTKGLIPPRTKKELLEHIKKVAVHFYGPFNAFEEQALEQASEDVLMQLSIPVSSSSVIFKLKLSIFLKKAVIQTINADILDFRNQLSYWQTQDIKDSNEVELKSLTNYLSSKDSDKSIKTLVAKSYIRRCTIKSDYLLRNDLLKKIAKSDKISARDMTILKNYASLNKLKLLDDHIAKNQDNALQRELQDFRKKDTYNRRLKKYNKKLKRFNNNIEAQIKEYEENPSSIFDYFLPKNYSMNNGMNTLREIKNFFLLLLQITVNSCENDKLDAELTEKFQAFVKLDKECNYLDYKHKNKANPLYGKATKGEKIKELKKMGDKRWVFRKFKPFYTSKVLTLFEQAQELINNKPHF